jgi:hypothetical protein
MNKLIILLLIILFCLIFGFYYNKAIKTYSNLGVKSDADVLLSDFYPIKKNNQLTNNNSYNIWWHYPQFTIGSYNQYTNNIKHQNNPDNGTCTPAEFCGSLYKNKYIKSNNIVPLKPTPITSGARVNYYNTNEQDNLFPFTSGLTNILY